MRQRYASSSGPQSGRRWHQEAENSEAEFSCRQFVPRCDCFRSGGNSNHLLLSWPRGDRGSRNGREFSQWQSLRPIDRTSFSGRSHCWALAFG